MTRCTYLYATDCNCVLIRRITRSFALVMRISPRVLRQFTFSYVCIHASVPEPATGRNHPGNPQVLHQPSNSPYMLIAFRTQTQTHGANRRSLHSCKVADIKDTLATCYMLPKERPGIIYVFHLPKQWCLLPRHRTKLKSA